MKFERWHSYKNKKVIEDNIDVDPEFPILSEEQNLIMNELKHNHIIYETFGFSKCDLYSALPVPITSLKELLEILKGQDLCSIKDIDEIFNAVDKPMECLCSIAPLGNQLVFNRMAYDCHGGHLYYFEKQKVFVLVGKGGSIKVINARGRVRELDIVDRMEAKGLILKFKGDSNLSFLNIV